MAQGTALTNFDYQLINYLIAGLPRFPDTFSILSASQPTSRTHSPKVTNPAIQSRNAVPPGAPRNDTFSDLSSGSLAGNHATANMTIAERAAAAQKAKLQQARAQHTTSAPLPSAWDGLDTLAQSSTTSRLQLLPQNHQQEATIGVYLTLLLLNRSLSPKRNLRKRSGTSMVLIHLHL
jgi:hypothetical protein